MVEIIVKEPDWELKRFGETEVENKGIYIENRDTAT